MCERLPVLTDRQAIFYNIFLRHLILKEKATITVKFHGDGASEIKIKTTGSTVGKDAAPKMKIGENKRYGGGLLPPFICHAEYVEK